MGTSSKISLKVEAAVQMAITKIEEQRAFNRKHRKPDKHGSYINKKEVELVMYKAGKEHGVRAAYIEKIIKAGARSPVKVHC